MLIPSLDIERGQAVQLIGGRELAIEAGDPLAVAERFAPLGELAVVDLDAARGRGSHRDVIRALVGRQPCRVGGGIRDYETAVQWLDAGAARLVIGTAARPELLRRLPKERLIAALDSEHGEVMTHGWQTGSGRPVLAAMAELRGLVGGFLVTFIEREGRCQGTDLAAVPALVEAAGDARLTIAGGVTSAAEIAELDRLGADAQVGMALYDGRLPLAEAFAAPLVSDRPDGLWPTLVVDPRGVALGLVYSNLESLSAALAERRGVYLSRSRGLWRKGESSGQTQRLLRVELDCDRDCLRFVVEQQGAGFCHLGTPSCFGPERGGGLAGLERRLSARLCGPPEPGSYTQRVLSEPGWLAAKLGEEAAELGAARGPVEAAEEAADLLYFGLLAALREGARLADIEAVLDRRALRVSRRPGLPKEVRP